MLHFQPKRRFLLTFVFIGLWIPLALWRIDPWPLGMNRVQIQATGVPQSSKAPRPLTLKEAYQLLQAHAQKLSEEAVITALQSVDVPGDTADAGQDGHRRGWLGTIQTSNAQIIVRVEDGSLVDSVTQPLSVAAPALPAPIVDSPEALHRVRSTVPHFDPAKDAKGQGFHFLLSVDELGSARIEVLGAIGTQRSKVLVDAPSGRILSAQSYTWVPEGGILYSADGGRTWHASTLRGRMVKAIAADPLDDHMGYAVAPDPQGIVLFRTQDGGRSWEEWSHLPPDAGDWPFDVAVIRNGEGRRTWFLGTWTGVWQSPDGRSWIRMADGPAGPVQWLARLKSERGGWVLASVTAGPNRGLYIWDGQRWRWAARGRYRLSPSSDESSVLALNEESPDQALLISLGSESPMDMPAPVLDAAGDFRRANRWLVRSPMGSVGLYQKDQGTIEWTLLGPIASLSISPAFPTDRVVLAGGFRSGIFRSADGGQHWERVLAQPSTVIPGSDEIYQIIFLSPTNVLAIQGGRATWR